MISTKKNLVALLFYFWIALGTYSGYSLAIPKATKFNTIMSAILWPMFHSKIFTYIQIKNANKRAQREPREQYFVKGISISDPNLLEQIEDLVHSHSY